MNKLLLLSLGAVLLIGACAPVVYGPGPQPGYVVAVEDRPYFTRGPYYIEHGRRWAWIRGHWARRHGVRVWIHGAYVVR